MRTPRDGEIRSQDLTDDQRAYLLHDSVWYEMLFTFGIPPHDRDDYCAWEAVSLSRIGHARALYEFFGEKRKRPSDLHASDFVDPHPTVVPLPADKNRLDWDLFHLTCSRVRHFQSADKPWTHTLLSILQPTCEEFIERLLSEASRFGGVLELERWRQLLDALRSGRELLISSKHGSERYSYDLGDPLPSGRACLTRFPPLFAPQQT